MQVKPFIDYYEIFQASSNASDDTIERLFRYQAKHLHPDVAESGDVQKFSRLVEAYETLRDPVKRAAYDHEYDREKQQHAKLIEDTSCLDDDSAQRHKMLSLLYARRRQDMKNPGIGDTTLEQLVGAPAEVISFHLWFFKEKGWVRREENGLLAITAEGVDRIETTIQKKAERIEKRLTSDCERIESHVFTAKARAR